MTYFPEFRYQVCGEIRVKYDSLGGSGSFLLFPTSNELVNPDISGRRQTFMNGPIYWHPNTGAHPVVNHFMMKWGEHNWEAGYLGYPTTDEIVLQNGRKQEFQGGTIYWSPLSLGAVGGAIRDKFNALGAETGPLGYPSSDEIPVAKYNGRYNNFLNGTITWSGPTGARVLYGAIRDKWAEFGREDGDMGYPNSDEQVTPDSIGHFSYFENGDPIYWSALTGAWRIPGGILAKWAAAGFESGEYGYPTWSSTISPDGKVVQEFEWGMLQDVGDYIYPSENEMDELNPLFDFEGSGNDDALARALKATSCESVTGFPHNSVHQPGTINVAVGVRCVGERAESVSVEWGLYRDGFPMKIAVPKTYYNVKDKNWGAGISVSKCIPGTYQGMGRMRIVLQPYMTPRDSGWMDVVGPEKYISCEE